MNIKEEIERQITALAASIENSRHTVREYEFKINYERGRLDTMNTTLMSYQDLLLKIDKDKS